MLGKRNPQHDSFWTLLLYLHNDSQQSMTVKCTMQLRGNALQYVGDPDAPRPARRGLNWRGLLSLKWRKDDKESVLCYVLFMALFVADFSFLAMVFPIVLYAYALLAQTPATRFWQASPPQPSPQSCSLSIAPGPCCFSAALHAHSIVGWNPSSKCSKCLTSALSSQQCDGLLWVRRRCWCSQRSFSLRSTHT